MNGEATALKIVNEQDDAPPSEVTSKRWIPKRWTPVYENIVALAVMGLDNVSIAKQFNFTPQQVSNIINTPQADVIKKLAIEKLRRSSLNTLEGRLDAIAEKAVSRIESVMNNEKIFENSPLAIMDRSMKLLESRGVMKPEGQRDAQGNVINNTQNNVVVVPNGVLDKFTAALAKSMEVKELDDPNFKHDIGRD